LYEFRGSEISQQRPLFTGDIVRGVEIPGVDEDEGTPSQLAMIVAHPCSMRDDGVRLRRRILVARVARGGDIGLAGWTGHFGKFPLPGFLGSGFDGPEVCNEETPDVADLSVALELSGRAERDSLRLDRRVTCLSKLGVAVLLQRKIFFETRLAVEVDALIEANEHVWLETELAQEWCETLCRRGEDENFESFSARLESECRNFDAFLGETRVMSGRKKGKYSLRDDLRELSRRAIVARKVRREIEEEFSRRIAPPVETSSPNPM
jgi:hypothetical protein